MKPPNRAGRSGPRAAQGLKGQNYWTMSLGYCHLVSLCSGVSSPRETLIASALLCSLVGEGEGPLMAVPPGSQVEQFLGGALRCS